MRNATFLLEALHPQDRLLRAWRDAAPPAPKARHNAYLEDYAALTLSLLSLYQTDPNPRWFAAAQRFARDILTHFTDPEGGFFDTRLDHEPLLLRPKDLQDNATPSGSALAATALLQLAAFTGDDAYRAAAENALQTVQPFLARYPTAFAQWLCAADFALSPTLEVALLTPPGEAVLTAFTRALWRTYRPHLVAAISPFPPPEGAPPLLAHRPLLDGKTTAYVCEGFVCQQPVDTPEAFAAQVKRIANSPS